MKLKIGGADAASLKADLIAVGVYQDEVAPAGEWSPEAARQLQALITKAGFGGQAGKARASASPTGFAAPRLLLIGLGRESVQDTVEQARRLGGWSLGKMGEHGASSVVVVPPDGQAATAAGCCEGVILADYAFTARKGKGDGSKPPKAAESTVTVAVSDAARSATKREVKILEDVARGTKLARDLGNEPSNVLTPEELAKRAQAIVRGRASEGLSCKVLGPAEIKKKKMDAFLSVAQGSDLPPRFIHLVYKPKKKTKDSQRVAIVGKGLTFDSGGISLKPGAGMEDMKYDMCGSATVLGLFEALPGLGCIHEVHGFVAACDNMPSGKSYKPGDIIGSMAGKTIEIINTDAEGRLTLADALTYAQTTKPDVMIDLATLTGACAIALGGATGIMSTNKDLQDALHEASDATGELAWPLPLFEDFKPQLKSDFADLKNLGDRYGGALTAGLFLGEFVSEDLPWAHMDIAGSGWSAKDGAYTPKGGTGVGVRTLSHWLRGL